MIVNSVQPVSTYESLVLEMRIYQQQLQNHKMWTGSGNLRVPRIYEGDSCTHDATVDLLS